MSRIAKNPIKISDSVECSFQEGIFSAKGKLGKIDTPINSNFKVTIDGDEVKVIPINENKNDPNWGLSLIHI